MSREVVLEAFDTIARSAPPLLANVASNPPRMIAPQILDRSNAPHPVARAAAACYNNFILWALQSLPDMETPT
jgi:hypothetical protein